MLQRFLATIDADTRRSVRAAWNGFVVSLTWIVLCVLLNIVGSWVTRWADPSDVWIRPTLWGINLILFISTILTIILTVVPALIDLYRIVERRWKGE